MTKRSVTAVKGKSLPLDVEYVEVKFKGIQVSLLCNRESQRLVCERFVLIPAWLNLSYVSPLSFFSNHIIILFQVYRIVSGILDTISTGDYQKCCLRSWRNTRASKQRGKRGKVCINYIPIISTASNVNFNKLTILISISSYFSSLHSSNVHFSQCRLTLISI